MRRFVFLFAALFAAAGFCHADEAPVPPQSLEELDARLATIFKDGAIPGAAVAVVENGTVVFTKGYGVADKAKAIPVTPDTVFRAASISKSFTGIAVMTAVQDGKLSLDDRVKDLAPEVAFDNPWEATDPLRLVHLLEHTTGWPDISLKVLTTDGKDWPLSKGVQEASPEYVSRWKPGRFAVYNNAGPAVAGLILEKATGWDFDTYMRERVLRPMGIATGDFQLTPELEARLSKSYAADGAETPFQYIILPPAGALDVSVKELAQVVRFFLGRGTVDGQEILTPESVARIERGESNVAAASGFASDAYGLGDAPFPDKGVTFRGHNGGIDSFTSVYGYSVEANAGYVLMANGGEGVDIAAPAASLIQSYLTRNAPMKPAPTVAVDQSELDGYAGLYRSITSANKLTQPYQEVVGLTRVTADKGKLVISGNDFLPTSRHTFRRADRESATLAFLEDEGQTYKVGAFGSQVKEPLWRAVVIVAVLGLIALGGAIAILMSPVWFIAWLRGRLAARGGAAVRFLPLLAVAALLVTFALPFVYLASGAIPEALLLAKPGPYAYTIFAGSILFPVFAALGLWRAFAASGAGIFVRGYATLTSLAILAFSAYAFSIGWVGAQTWTM